MIALRIDLSMERMNQSGGNKMNFKLETLINIVPVLGGYERHYRIEGSTNIKIVFVARPCMKRGGN